MTNNQNWILKNSTFLLILFCILMYALMRLYFYFHITPNATIYLKENSCDIAKIMQSDNCKISGNLRNDLFTNGYIIESKGKQIYLSRDVVDGFGFVVDQRE